MDKKGFHASSIDIINEIDWNWDWSQTVQQRELGEGIYFCIEEIENTAKEHSFIFANKIYYYPLAVLSADICIDDNSRIVDFDNKQFKDFVALLRKDTKKEYTDQEIRIMIVQKWIKSRKIDAVTGTLHKRGVRSKFMSLNALSLIKRDTIRRENRYE